jgi:tumor protein p53-inducible protein 3
MKALVTDMDNGRCVMRPGVHPDPVADENDLLVKIEATALNRADLLQKEGKYPPPRGESPILGLEMAGIVVECGNNVVGFKNGDFVYGLLGGGGYAEYCTIDHRLAMHIPDEFSFEEAAAIPEVFLTAYQALFLLGNLKKGEIVLVHAGASGVGSAAIQLAGVLRQAFVITTAGSDEKLETCRVLGADLAINYKKELFSEIIQKQKGNDSVNLIIDFVGAPYWDMNVDVLSTDGRLVYLSMLGGAAIENFSLIPVLRKRLAIMGSTLRNRPLSYKIELKKNFEQETAVLFRDKKLNPVIDSIYDWKDVEKAHQRMAENRNSGKIILTGM